MLATNTKTNDDTVRYLISLGADTPTANAMMKVARIQLFSRESQNQIDYRNNRQIKNISNKCNQLSINY